MSTGTRKPLAAPPSTKMASALSTVLLYSLLPLLVAVLTLLVLPSARPLRSHLRPFLLSLVTLPVLDLVARLYPLQPFFPFLLLALLSTLLSLSFLFHLLSVAFANIVEFFSAFYRALNLASLFALIRAFEDIRVPPRVSSAYNAFEAVLSAAINALNSTQLADCAHIPPWFRALGFTFSANPDRIYKYGTEEWKLFKALVRDLVLCPCVFLSVPPVNAATRDLIATLDVAAFFNSSTLPVKFRPGLHQLTAALRAAGEHFNITELFVDNHISPGFTAALERFPPAFVQLYETANFTALIADATAKPAAQQALATMRAVGEQPAKLSTIAFPKEQFDSTASVARGFLANMPVSVRAALLALAAVMAVVPLLFLVRAGAVEAIKTALTQRYERVTPGGERTASGWLRAGAASALGVAVAEAVPFCAVFGAMAGAGFGASVELAVHALAVVPLHVVTQLRVAEALARRDVLKDGAVRVGRAFAVATMLHAGVGMWWNWTALIVVGTGFRGCVVVDVLPVVGVILWGRRICQRVLRDERITVEERERKDD